MIWRWAEGLEMPVHGTGLKGQEALAFKGCRRQIQMTKAIRYLNSWMF